MNLAAREVLFVDDSHRNVLAARALGLHAELVADATQARAVLHDYGVL
jgi:FMN phosphatase YigB (HAD superfamily)